MPLVRIFDVAVCPDCGALVRDAGPDSCCKRHRSPAPRHATLMLRARAAGSRLRPNQPTPVRVVTGTPKPATVHLEGQALAKRARPQPQYQPRVVTGKPRPVVVRFRAYARGRAPQRIRLKLETAAVEQYGRNRRKGPSAEIEAAIYRFAQRNAMSYEMAAHLWGYQHDADR